ncbi:MAG TPA: histone deacetylase [Cytophagales bacterium]|nr:histone deacetylase [Cytophagales bacterium]
MIKVAYSDKFVLDLPEGHKFPMIKYELIKEQLQYEGTLPTENLFCPDICQDDIVMLTHEKSYIQRLRQHELTEMEIRKIGFPFSDTLVNRCFTSTRGTVDCGLYALQHGIALNTAGGTHHAFKEKGEAFCVINDIAVAANYLMAVGLAKKILIIDLDVHQGNGTAKIFQGDNRVFTFSVHGADNYPLRKEVSDLDIALPSYIDDSTYLELIQKHIPQLLNQVKPDIVFYLAGVDILVTDKLGKLNVSKEGCQIRDEIVMAHCKEMQIPIAVSMGGGYSEHVRDTVDAHCNTFRTAFDIWG